GSSTTLPQRTRGHVHRSKPCGCRSASRSSDRRRLLQTFSFLPRSSHRDGSNDARLPTRKVPTMFFGQLTSSSASTLSTGLHPCRVCLHLSCSRDVLWGPVRRPRLAAAIVSRGTRPIREPPCH